MINKRVSPLDEAHRSPVLCMSIAGLWWKPTSLLCVDCGPYLALAGDNAAVPARNSHGTQLQGNHSQGEELLSNSRAKLRSGFLVSMRAWSKKKGIMPKRAAGKSPLLLQLLSYSKSRWTKGTENKSFLPKNEPFCRIVQWYCSLKIKIQSPRVALL